MTVAANSKNNTQFAMQRRVKVLLLGNTGVGKTSLVQRLLGQEAAAGSSPSPTVGVDFAAHAVQLEGEQWPLRLNVWDTSGDPRFRELVEGCMRDLRHRDAVIVVYDVTRRSTFEAAEAWVAAVREAATQVDPLVVLLGNKADFDSARAVSAAEGEAKAKALGISVFAEVSHSVEPGSEGDVAALLRSKLLPQCNAAMPTATRSDCVSYVDGEEDLPRRCMSPTKWLQPMLRCAGFS